MVRVTCDVIISVERLAAFQWDRSRFGNFRGYRIPITDALEPDWEGGYFLHMAGSVRSVFTHCVDKPGWAPGWLFLTNTVVYSDNRHYTIGRAACRHGCC